MREFCEKYGITEDQFYGRVMIEGDLNLNDVTNIPYGFNPWVEFELWMGSLVSIHEGFSPVVGGDLDLSNVKSLPHGFRPFIGGNLYLAGIKNIRYASNPVVGGDLVLINTECIHAKFCPIVGGNLILNKLKSIKHVFRPVVGKCIYALGITSIDDLFTPTVGKHLYLRNGIEYNCNRLNKNQLVSSTDGKYIMVDGIVAEVVNNTGSVYHARRPNSDDLFYITCDGNGKWSHSDTFDSEKHELIFNYDI